MVKLQKEFTVTQLDDDFAASFGAFLDRIATN